ncbi:hypothetical protein [Kaarinaea lacus]
MAYDDIITAELFILEIGIKNIRVNVYFQFRVKMQGAGSNKFKGDLVLKKEKEGGSENFTENGWKRYAKKNRVNVK